MTKDTINQLGLAEPDNAIQRVLRLYFVITDKIESIIWKACIIAGVVLVIVITAQVVTRYVFGFVPAWGNELGRYLMIWITLLLAGVLVKNDQHLQVEFIFQYLPLTVRRIIRSIELLIIAWIGLFFLFQGWYYAVTSGFQSTAPAMGFNMFWAYVFFPIAGVVIILSSVRKLIEINYDPEALERDYQRRFEAYEAEQADDVRQDVPGTEQPTTTQQQGDS